ncbi:hypothetical protein [Streptomyces sp. AC154]|uniref:hypothetical protein n=1 Tax=Streptomyces sp. AC154 TaxID=3143184 RepID=UPI003F7E8D5C
MTDAELATSRDPGGWVAPLMSTVVTLPFAFYAMVWGMFSPMACDSCMEAEADRFEASFDIAFPVLVCGLVLALILLVVSWCLPRRPDRVAPRVLLALLAPVTVGLDLLLFVGILDTP